MSFDLGALIGQIGRDKGIDRQLLIEAVESAMLSAARKHYGHGLNLEARLDEKTGKVEVLMFKTVVDKVEDPDTQINLEDARREFDAEAMVGDEIGKSLDTTELGRIAAQTAKQVIIQKVRDAERGVIYEEYKDSKGELINGIVQRYDRGNVVVNLGRTEAIMPKREQIPRERYRQGDRVRCMILDIDRSARGPQIILTRSHPDLVRKLFALEVPEIAEGIIEIKAIAREPGERTKIAVASSDSNVDPLGACVGIRGSRVNAVVQELRGEKIDVVEWTADEHEYIRQAFSPLERSNVVSVELYDDERTAEVVVTDEHLSLAIGRRGQNVKLASRLTGWKIDVRSKTVADESAKRARAALSSIPGLEFTHAELLYQDGYRSIKDVADANLEDLADVEGFTAESASQVLEAAKKMAEQQVQESGGDDGDDNESRVRDLDQLLITPELREKLIVGGYTTVQSIVGADHTELLKVPGVGEPELEMIRDATDAFFARSGPKGYFKEGAA